MTSTPPRHHLFITGTGRAGTSFLVRYLSTLGLDTVLSRGGEGAVWDEHANAGLEQRPTEDLFGENSPYVIKSPLLHEYIDEILNNPNIILDAVILPVRDVMEASASRLILERRSIYQNHPWMAELEAPWESWGGGTPGGALYSLNMVDQARIISAAFYKVVERLSARDIPIIFLHFPRFVEDAHYLYEKLKAVLPAQTTASQAREVHDNLADKGQVRVGKELGDGAQSASTPSGPKSDGIPTHSDLDHIAIKREVVRLNKLLAEIDLPRGSKMWTLIKTVRKVRAKLSGKSIASR